ncbi:MAG: leucine-rich repeat protein, partial [Duncaniella sp.]|nr:leucine-rich repeat protein [Duncaniella sp.]
RNLTSAPDFDEPLLAWRYLTTAIFGEKVTRVPAKLFSGSTMLSNIDFSASNIETIGAEAFNSTTRLANVTLPSTLRTIGNRAFSGAGLKSLELNDGLEQVCDSAFYNCGKLVSITIPESLKTVGNGAFYAGASAAKINIASTDKKFDLIDDYAFVGQEFLDAVTISADRIGKNAFENANFNSSAYIKADRAENNAFKGSKFDKADFRIRVLGDSAFASSNIPDLHIATDSVAGNPFIDATLAKADIEVAKYIQSVDFCKGQQFNSLTVKAYSLRGFNSCKADTVSIEAEKCYQSTTDYFSGLQPLSNEYVDVEIQTAGELSGFKGATKIGVIKIGGIATAFLNGARARKACYDLPIINKGIHCDSLELGDNVTKIYDSAFKSYEVSSIKFGTGLLSIGQYAFYNHKCTSIEFPYVEGAEPMLNISSYAFQINIDNGNKTPASTSPYSRVIKLGNLVKSVGESSFANSSYYYYYGNNYVYYPVDTLDLGQVKTIGKDAFIYPSKVVVPGSVVKMEDCTPKKINQIKALTFEYGPDEIDFKLTLSNKLDSLYVAHSFKSAQKINAARVILGDNPDEQFDFKYSGTAGSISVGSSTRSMTFSGASVGNTELHIPASVTKMEGTLTLPAMTRLSLADAGADSTLDMSALTLTAPEATYLYQGRNLAVGENPVGKLTSWKEVVFGDEVTAIAPYSFKGCADLTTAVLPPSIKSIGKEAFRDCASLTTVEFPESLTDVQQDAYFGCDGVEKVVARGMMPADGDFAFAEDFMERVPLYVPEEAFDEYFYHPNFTYFFDYDHLLTLADGGIIKDIEAEPNPDAEPVDEFKPGDTHHLPSLWKIIKYIYKRVTGQNAPMRAVVDENGEAADIRLAWVSSNPDIASVDAEGYVTIHKDAPVEITAYATDGSGKKVSFVLNEEVLRGDANGDKVVNGLDVNAIIDGIVDSEGHTLKLKVADINMDGEINGLDVNALIEKIVNTNNSENE